MVETIETKSEAGKERFTMLLRESLNETKLLTHTERAKAFVQLAECAANVRVLGNYLRFEF